jgi:hypothetical protein
VVVVVVMVIMRLGTWNRANRERNSGDGGQHESKLPHRNFSLGFTSIPSSDHAPIRQSRMVNIAQVDKNIAGRSPARAPRPTEHHHRTVTPGRRRGAGEASFAGGNEPTIMMTTTTIADD